jgi:hypothetical protein
MKIAAMLVKAAANPNERALCQRAELDASRFLFSLQFESNFSSTRAMNLLPLCPVPLRLFTQEREWDAFKK